MWNGDYRFLSIAREETEDLTLGEVKSAITSQMTTDAVEVRRKGEEMGRGEEDVLCHAKWW